MADKNKTGISFRIVVATIVFTAIIIASCIVAMMAIQYLSGHVQDPQVLEATQVFNIIFLLFIGGAVVFLVFCIYAMINRVQHPLNALGKMADYLAKSGNLKIPDDMAKSLKRYENASSEIGSVITSFDMLAEGLMEKVAVLEAVARGDLRVRANPTGDEDNLAVAVNDVVTNLSNIVRDVITATEQLSVGANELSIGAQSLSQSSSQQSATMDKLHLTAGEIAAEAAENADRAAEASVLTAQIRSNATEGGRKMLDMTSAMSEINKASHSIGSVMKVIDEIAFQTNILALNAAVEAARAGVHGKGFAVVADEVRNLATKSGEAANDTNTMIADTISKSEMGTKIVDEAIAFFKTIEDGIANINDLLDEIAKATKSQSLATEQVTRSLTDMTNVVYHNSATSEQSAAASEQMNSQALILKETVNRFLLKEETKPAGIFSESAQLPKSVPLRDFPAQAQVFPEQDFIFTAPEIEALPFNPTTAPSEDGGLSPAEIYAEALERETLVNKPLPAPEPAQWPAPSFAAPTKMADAGEESGFTDDDSKY